MSPESLEKLNRASVEEATATLARCCGAQSWAREMVTRRPFSDLETLKLTADEVWFDLPPEAWREAFDHHPRIGADVAKLREKFSATADWSEGEQAGVEAASEETLEALAQGNRDYEARYGFLFLVCASGKTADEMLELLRGRMDNTPEAELAIAAGEQAKITRIRLEKL